MLDFKTYKNNFVSQKHTAKNYLAVSFEEISKIFYSKKRGSKILFVVVLKNFDNQRKAINIFKNKFMRPFTQQKSAFSGKENRFINVDSQLIFTTQKSLDLWQDREKYKDVKLKKFRVKCNEGIL